ncbi:MAG: FlgD immunoglobulin-like domain containing protein, partial [Candidatus Zixiibacteriota bacterium]
ALASGTGGGHTWDFSNVTFDLGAYTSRVINASAAPSNSIFTGADKAWSTDFVTSWTFFSTPTNEIRHHGSISTFGVAPNIDTIKLIFDAPSLQYKFPITGNSTWINKWQYSLEYLDHDTLLYTSTVRDSIEWVCDAWGTIKYKSRQVDALRLKGTMYVTSVTTYPGMTPTVNSTSSEQLQFITLEYDGGGVTVSKSVTPGGTFYSGSADYRFVQAATPVYEQPGSTLPTQFSVEQNTPNPFNPETSIGYSLPTSGSVKFQVLNTLGQVVWNEDFGTQPAGNYQIRWYGRNANNEQLPSGVYFYRLTAGENTVTRKMILLK